MWAKCSLWNCQSGGNVKGQLFYPADGCDTVPRGPTALTCSHLQLRTCVGSHCCQCACSEPEMTVLRTRLKSLVSLSSTHCGVQAIRKTIRRGVKNAQIVHAGGRDLLAPSLQMCSVKSGNRAWNVRVATWRVIVARVEMVSLWGRKSTVTRVKVDKSIGHLIHDSSAMAWTWRLAAFISTVHPWRCVRLWEPQAPFTLSLLPFCYCFEVDVLQMICWCLSEHLVKAMAWKIIQRGGCFFFSAFRSLKQSVFLTFGFWELLSIARNSTIICCV